MKTIVVLDTGVNDPNLGNEIIMDAVNYELRTMFPHDFILHVPALEYIQAGRKLVQSADHVFLGGTNVLSSDMNRTSEWRIRLRDLLWMNNVILMGVGWWQYQGFTPNMYTRFLLKGILHSKANHSVRDSYTENKISPIITNVQNTGCPTMWQLNAHHCSLIPAHRSDTALITFTVYKQNEQSDLQLFEIIKRNYTRILFWPQQPGDYEYARRIIDTDVEVLDPSLDALNAALSLGAVDYIGTRLHAGIRALQYKRRSIIISVDNRAAEMGNNFNLPVISRKDIQSLLESRIKSTWATEVRLPEKSITAWKKQFGEKCQEVNI